MEEYVVKLVGIESVTHDVKHFILEKPDGYKFIPGQATEVSINKPEWKKEKRPFTFTSLNESENLEFVIKGYQERNGVTKALHELKPGDEIIIRDVWGAINYKGKGVFIAAGAGITPFIAIFRQLCKDNAINGNKLFFSNKTQADIILREEFEKMLGSNFVNVLTKEKVPGMHHGHIDKKYLVENISDFKQNFYLCGPDKFVESVHDILVELGAKVESVVVEK